MFVSSTAILCDCRDWAAAALCFGDEHVANTDADSRNSLRASAATRRRAFGEAAHAKRPSKSVNRSSRRAICETRQKTTGF